MIAAFVENFVATLSYNIIISSTHLKGMSLFNLSKMPSFHHNFNFFQTGNFRHLEYRPKVHRSGSPSLSFNIVVTFVRETPKMEIF